MDLRPRRAAHQDIYPDNPTTPGRERMPVAEQLQSVPFREYMEQAQRDSEAIRPDWARELHADA